jgi:hypothetical protein
MSEGGDDVGRSQSMTARGRSFFGLQNLLVLPVILWTVLSAALMARDPWLGAAVGVAPIVIFLIVRNATVRFLVVVVGGLLVLGSSGDLSANKLVYAALLVLCAAISAVRLVINPPAYAHHFRPLLWVGLALLAILFLSYLASPAGADLGTFGRQAIFYLLIVLGPLIGLDAGRDLPPRITYPLVGVLGLVAAVGFAFDWLERRGVTALSSGRFILSSLMLPAFAFSLALVLVFHSPKVRMRLLWMLPVIGIPIAMLVTGTRTNLIVFAGILAVMGKRRSMRVRPLQMLSLLVVGGALGAVLFPIVASVAIADPDFIQSRIRASLTVLSGQGAADQSYAIRANAYQVATQLIDRSPVFGMGLGYTIPITLDTPLLTIVRLGILGTLAVAAFVLTLAWSIRRATVAIGPSPATTAWWGLLLVMLSNIPFGTPLEDRGFGFTLLLAMVAMSSAFQETLTAGTHAEVTPTRVRQSRLSRADMSAVGGADSSRRAVGAGLPRGLA